MKGSKIFLMTMTASALLGCQEGSRGPAGAPEVAVPGISALIEVAPYGEVSISASVAIDEAPSVPSVQLNDVYNSSPEGDGGFYQFEFNDLPFSPGDSVHLVVNYIKEDGSPGEAFGDIVIPDTFLIISPDTFHFGGPPGEEYPLNLGDSLRVEWLAPEGARAYWVWFNLQYYYLDTVGVEKAFNMSLDTLIAANSLSFGPADLFPDLAGVDSLLQSNGHFDLRAKSGPLLPGDLANIHGDGQGFFNAWSEIEYFNIYVQP